MNTFIEKIIKSSIFGSIGLIILGILLFLYSELTIVSISYVIGGLLVAIGVMALIKYINNANKNTQNELDIVYGVGTVILGIIVISNPKAIASIIPFVLGIIMVFNSSVKLQYCFELKKGKNELWSSTMIMTVLTLTCGIFLVFNPFKGAEVITKIVGCIIIAYGILDMISSLRIRKTINTIQKVIEDNKVKDADVIEDRTTDNHIIKKEEDNKGEEE